MVYRNLKGNEYDRRDQLTGYITVTRNGTHGQHDGGRSMKKNWFYKDLTKVRIQTSIMILLKLITTGW